MSGSLSSGKGLLPVPMIITEPAVGYGFGLGLGFFRSGMRRASWDPDRLVAPSIFAIGGMKTQNGTWAVGGGFRGVWKDDRIRYLAAGGTADVNLSYYGEGGRFPPVDYSLNGSGFIQDLQLRIGGSRDFVRERRLLEAAERLAASEERISVISFGVGFGDVSNFNHAFKKRFGVPPREYRDAKRNAAGAHQAETRETKQ